MKFFLEEVTRQCKAQNEVLKHRMVILETYRKKLSMFVQKGQSPESQAFSSNSFSDRQYDSVGRVKYSTEP